MSAAAVAARARDPDRVANNAPNSVLYEEPANSTPATAKAEVIGNGLNSERLANGGPGKFKEQLPNGGPGKAEEQLANGGPAKAEVRFSEGSSHNGSSGRQEQKTPFQTSSLPPEILGLFKKTGNHSPETSTHYQESERNAQPSSPARQTNDRLTTMSIGGEQPVDHVIAEPMWNPATMDSCPVIVIPKNFAPKEGSKLTDDLVVGSHISSGLQGGVYDLKNLDGSKANMVFKLVHTHALLAEVEREWEVGMRLNQLAEMDGSLPGFMGVGAGIRGGGKFRGMLLERLHGTTVDKIICTRDFHDVHYVYSMLYSIFTALDRAQGALGFHHSDLRLANVMEIQLPESNGERVAETASERRLSTNLEELQAMETRKQKESSPQMLEKLRYQFKIIDYGLANFDETYAAGPDVVVVEEGDTGSQLGANSRRSLHYQNLQMQRQNSVSPATGCVPAFPFPMVKQNKLENLPNTSPLEKLYRYMWRRKGDVYHLVFELGEWLDGRVWPSKDELDVLRLVDFIEHVTGVRMKFWFSDDMTGENSVGGWSDRALGPFERHDSFLHFLRRYSIRLRSWINPSNPGITAAEALTAPFFTKRISLRGIIHGCSTLYARWTKAPKKKTGQRDSRPVVKKSKSEMRKIPSGAPR